MSPPTSLLVIAGIVAAADAALCEWRPPRTAVPRNLFFLSIPWLPFFALPHVGPRTVTGIVALLALLALLAMLNFSRVVRLSNDGGFFVPAFTLVAMCFPLAVFRQGVLLSAVPGVAILGLAATTAAGARVVHDGFLQKLALSWLAVFVYGYLYAHAALFAHASWGAVPGTTMLALVILMAKFAHVASLAVKRLVQGHRAHLIVTPVAGFVGGRVVAVVWPTVASFRLAAVGVVVGVALAVGLRSHTAIVAEVTAQPARQRKGTVVFAFALALAAGYWALSVARYAATSTSTTAP